MRPIEDVTKGVQSATQPLLGGFLLQRQKLLCLIELVIGGGRIAHEKSAEGPRRERVLLFQLKGVHSAKEFGIDPGKLAAFDGDLATGKYGFVDSMLVLRCGTAVYDKSYAHDYGQIYGERAKKEGGIIAKPEEANAPFAQQFSYTIVLQKN